MLYYDIIIILEQAPDWDGSTEQIKRRMPGTEIIPKRIHGTEVVRGLVVDREGVTVKIEPNLVLRGSVYPPEIKL